MRLLFILIFSCSTHFSFSQGFDLFAIGGLAATQVSGDNLSGFHKPGLIGGLGIIRPVGDKTSLLMEMIYIQKGSRKIPTLEDDAFYLMKLNYVEVPLMAKFRKGKFHYETGLSFGALIRSSVEDIAGPYPLGHPESRPFKRQELSFNLSIEYELMNNISMNWRLSNSILPIREHMFGSTFRFNRGQYNTCLEFTLRYTFNANKSSNE